MVFKFKMGKNSFKLNLDRDVSNEEFAQIAQIASNLITPKEHKPKEDVKPAAPSIQPPFISSSPSRLQQRLGEFPVKEIKIGDYKEPETGVRIRMLSLPDYGGKKRMDAIRALRDNTQISIMACKEIVYGNYPCPIIKPEVAEVVMARFRELDIHARAVRTSKSETGA